MGVFGHNGWLSKQGKKLKDNEELLNPIHAIDKIIEGGNKAAEAAGLPTPDGPTGQFNDPTVGVEFSTNTLTGPEQQAINTTAYNEQGGYDMIQSSNTAYDEQPKEDTWWDRNKDWVVPVATTGATMLYNTALQRENNKFNADQAEKNREFQEYMARNQHQIEYADLVAAGINPVNTATGGSGAGIPGGAQASGTTPPYMDHSSMANTALSLAETMKVLNENKYISAEKKSQIANTIADTTNKSANTENIQANTQLQKQQIKELKEEIRIKRQNADYNDLIGSSDNEPETLRKIKAALYTTGVHDLLNPNNRSGPEQAVAEVKSFVSWLKTENLMPLPAQQVNQAWKIYKEIKNQK